GVHAEVGGRVAALAVHQDVVVGRCTDQVAPDAAVELLLAGRDVLRGEPADVEELLAAGQPRDGGVAAAVDRPVDHLAGGDVQDVEAGFLLAPRGGVVGAAGGPPRAG